MNMSTKHTSGPWISSSCGFQVLGGKSMVSVCQLYGKQPQIVREANARLIAAAPEMYEMIKDLAEAWDMNNYRDEVRDLFKKLNEHL